MMQKDSAFKKKLLETFKIEAAEHLNNLSSRLVEMEKGVDEERRAAIVESVFREAHSLKGAARVVSLTDVESVCQALENIFATLKRNELVLNQVGFDRMHSSIEVLRTILAGLEAPLSTSTSDLAGNTIRSLDSILKLQDAPDIPAEHIRDKVENGERSVPESPATPAPPYETIRIAVARLESVLLQSEELLSAKQAANRFSRELDEINSGFSDWEREWQKISSRANHLRSQVKTEPALTSGKTGQSIERISEFLEWNHDYVKSLENRIAKLTRISQLDRNSLVGMIDNLTQEMKKVMMSPFSSATEMFPKLVRDLSREQGKQIDISIRGEEIEIDRRILEEIKDPLMHMIRNCVDHGIERPEIRRQKNKPAQGRIALDIHPKGSSNIEITVADDGEGIDLGGLRNSAINIKLLSQGESDKLSDSEILSLIFRSGVSTSKTVTGISGRGLGLAIAHEKVDKLRGSIGVESKTGLGTTFRIVLPLTLAEFHGLVIKTGGQTLVVPAVNVDQVLRVKKDDIQSAEGFATIKFSGKAVALVPLADVLDLEYEEGGNGSSAYLPVVVLTMGETQLAFVVDEIVGEQEVLVKSLGKQLSRVRNIAGASMLSGGKIVPVLNVADLMKSAIKVQTSKKTAGGQPETNPQQSILVVEDSITARTLLKNILETTGYRVRTAVDGQDAFNQLKTEKFDLVVSDVDMPVMNGFDLTTKIRADRQLAALPVILVTALESRQHRERGMEVGANAYIVKSSFDQGNLLDAIRRLI